MSDYIIEDEKHAAWLLIQNIESSSKQKGKERKNSFALIVIRYDECVTRQGVEFVDILSDGENDPSAKRKKKQQRLLRTMTTRMRYMPNNCPGR